MITSQGILAAAVIGMARPAQADDDAGVDHGRTLPTILVPPPRNTQPERDVPAAIDALRIDSRRDDRFGTRLSEVLALVPGMLARNRHNHARDEQIPIRGFGARAPVPTCAVAAPVRSATTST